MKLFQRIGFAVRQAWLHRERLKHYLDDPALQIKSVNLLSLSRLQSEGIRVLVLDFDGVLGPDRALVPSEAFVSWLDQMYAHYQDKLFVLSNKPLVVREQHLKEKYPRLQFIKGVLKKPYPDGLALIKSMTNESGNHILFCDDRLLTGILAAELAGVRALWVTDPCRDFSGRFWHEAFFAFLRLIDRNFLRACG